MFAEKRFYTRFYYSVALFAVPGLLAGFSSGATRIDGIQYRYNGHESVIEISGKDLAGVQKDEKKTPPQLVLTFEDANVAASALKKMEPSLFRGNVLQVTTYPLNSISGKASQARVVIDFKKSAEYALTEGDGKLEIKIAEKGSGGIADTFSVSTTASSNEPPSPDAAPTASDPVAQAAVAQLDKRFTGSPITLNLKDAEAAEVLRMISDASGFNIVVHPSVTGKITVNLDHVPWDQALEVVLSTLKLGAERSQSVLRVMPRDMLIAEKKDALDTKRISGQNAPRITRVFPISYSDLNKLANLLDRFANSNKDAPGGSGVQTTVLVDETTQSLIVRDTEDGLDRIKKMIQILDVQTPQVMIEGKVVEATEGFSNNIGGQLGGGTSKYGFSANGTTNLIGAPTIGGAPGSATAGQLGAAGAGAFALADVFNIAGRAISLNASLNMAEQENKIRVVSSPKVAVLSGKSATISQTNSIGVTVITPATATSPATTQIVPVNAITKLTVTPRVANDGAVLLHLNLQRDILSTTDPTKSPVTEPRMMNTEVFVDSGSTLVIGGVLNVDENRSETGMPVLRKIPIIGWLFGSESLIKSKTELMFFITPRVLNQKKSGIISAETGSGAAKL